MSELTLLHAYSWKALWLYVLGFLFFFRLSIQIIPLIQKINLVKTGDEDQNNSSASFTYFTMFFLTNMTELITAKYNSTLSDYIGRKPLLLGSGIFFAVAHFMIATYSSDLVFYTAAVYGNLIQSNPIVIAWICDAVEPNARGQALGILLGASIGASFALGLPLGITLSAMYSPDMPIYVSSLVSLIAAIYALLIPLADTKSALLKMQLNREEQVESDGDDRVETVEEEISTIAPIVGVYSVDEAKSQDYIPILSTTITSTPPPLSSSSSSSSPSSSQGSKKSHDLSCYDRIMKDRALPTGSFLLFVLSQHPLAGLHVIRKSARPMYFACYFFSFISQQVLNIVFIEYCVNVFNWTTSFAGVLTAIIGLSIGFFAPCMSGRYEDRALYPLGAFSCGVGAVFMAMAGTSSSMGFKYTMGGVGILLQCFGGFYLPSLQSIITKQYSEDRQGEAMGVLQTLGQLSNVFSYPTSLLFTYIISSKSSINFPGLVFLLVGFYQFVGTAIYYYIHGWDGFVLTRRSKIRSERKDAALAENNKDDSTGLRKSLIL